MPRSLRCCYDRLTETLEDLCGTSARRNASASRAEFIRDCGTGGLARCSMRGLHEFLTEFIDGNAQVGQQLARDFMMVR